MRRASCLLVILFLLFALNGCSMVGETEEDIAALPPSPIIPDEEPLPPEEPPEDYSGEEGMDEKRLSMERGGKLLLADGTFAFLTPDGRLSLGRGGDMTVISGVETDRIYFDGTAVYAVTPKGIVRYLDGEEQVLSEVQPPFLRLDGEKIYYIRPEGASHETGELWAMDLDGSGAVIILPERVQGEFFIRSGFLIFKTPSGELRRSQLRGGSESTLLARDVDEIVLATRSGAYYRTGEKLRRVAYRTGAERALGVQGQALWIGDTVYVLARGERDGMVENLFSLTPYREGEDTRRIITFQNLGDDRLAYVWGESVYLQSPGGEFTRMSLSDSEQTKVPFAPAGAVFLDGTAYYLDGGAVASVPCE